MATGITPGKPTTVNTYMVYINGIGSQTQQSGSNTIVVPYAITTTSGTQTYYGFIGTKYTSYTGRCIILNIAGTTQRRVVVSQTAGTGSTIICTVNKDWDTVPTSTDTLHVAYEMDDLETGGSNTGVALGVRTGTYDWTGILNIGDGTQYAGLYMGAGEGTDINDGGSTVSVLVKNNARLDMGYRNDSGAVLSGGIVLCTQNTDGEPTIQFQSGSKGEIVDSLLWGQIKALFYENAAGSAVVHRGTKLLSATYGSIFFGSSLYSCAISGRSGANEFIRFNASSTVDGLILEKTAGITGTDDTSTEIITLKGVVFANNLALITLNSNKTFYVINPAWTATTYSDFTWTTSTANYVYDQRSVDATAQKADGTLIADANVIMYENTILADLVLETYTNASGVASGAFTYKKHETNSATTTYGGFAYRVDCWLYTPFISSQTATLARSGVVVLNTDTNIVQTTQATALSAGSGITWNSETNSSSVIEYTGGSGTLSAGNTVTGDSSGADGIVTKIVSGDSTEGIIHLKTRDGNAFSGTETLSNGAGWTATLTSGSEKRFKIWIDGNSLAMQTIYDYLAALTSETTLSATGELIHEWGRDTETRALYNGTEGFYTNRSYSKGVYITNVSNIGTVDYFTDDSGGTWEPPASVTVTVTVRDKNGNLLEDVQTGVYTISDRTEILNMDTAAGEATTSYTGTTPVNVEVRCRKASLGAPKYKNFSSNQTIGATGLDFAVTMEVDPNNNAEE